MALATPSLRSQTNKTRGRRENRLVALTRQHHLVQLYAVYPYALGQAVDIELQWSLLRINQSWTTFPFGLVSRLVSTTP